ncbi:MAG: DHHA1 domain-containing protein [Myxococcales bacterium]
MTDRPYLDDPYLSRFSARVQAVQLLDGRPAVILYRSAFYPEGGGQPGDRGVLAPAKAFGAKVAVLDTQERDGELFHLVADPAALEPEAALEARVDWERRFDHMQQHHGQHLLSAAFARVHGAPTRSFHLGERICTIDLDCPIGRLDAPALRRAEAAANETIWRDLPVVARDFGGEERARLTLRKEAVKGNRVVLVEGVDASPCGGTHPRRTGEVGAIALLRAQRWGEGMARVEFVCGGRVVARLAEAGEVVARAAEALKAAPADLADAARRLAAESHARRKAVEALEAELSLHRARDLAATQPAGPVMASFPGGAGFARAVAAALVRLGRVALVAGVEEGKAHLVFSRPKGAGPALNAVLQEALALVGGKGGGSPEHAQGSGEPARLAEALAAAAGRLRG